MDGAVAGTMGTPTPAIVPTADSVLDLIDKALAEQGDVIAQLGNRLEGIMRPSVPCAQTPQADKAANSTLVNKLGEQAGGIMGHTSLLRDMLERCSL